MLWGFFGNFIFAIIARMLCRNHLNVICIRKESCISLSCRLLLVQYGRTLLSCSLPITIAFLSSVQIDKWMNMVNFKLSNKMWKVNWSTAHECAGTIKEKVWVPNRNHQNSPWSLFIYHTHDDFVEWPPGACMVVRENLSGTLISWLFTFLSVNYS